MASADWAERQQILLAAGILVTGQETKKKIENLPDLTPLIEAATSSQVHVLSSRSIDELLMLVPSSESESLRYRTSAQVKPVLNTVSTSLWMKINGGPDRN